MAVNQAPLEAAMRDETRECDSARGKGTLKVPREPPRLHVVLFEPEIAANTGAIGRTCVAAGARLWLVRPLGFHLDDRHLRRAALDYWEHLNLCVVNELGVVAERLGRNRLWSFSTKAD